MNAQQRADGPDIRNDDDVRAVARAMEHDLPRANSDDAEYWCDSCGAGWTTQKQDGERVSVEVDARLFRPCTRRMHTTYRFEKGGGARR